MGCIGIVGTGFVADLYMRSLATFPDLRVGRAYDINQARLGAFCTHWNISAARSLGQLLDEGPNSPTLILKSYQSRRALRGKSRVPQGREARVF